MTTTAIESAAPWTHRVLSTEPPGSAAWRSAHKGRMGAGHIAAVLLDGEVDGRGRPLARSTITQAWAELCDHVEPEDISAKPWIKRGVALEPVVARLYSEDAQRPLFPSPGLVRHPDVDWVALTPDFRTEIQGQPALVECKTAGFGHAAEWEAQIPVHVMVQLTMQLVVCGMDVGSAACMPIDLDDESEPILWQDLVLDPLLVDRIMNELTVFRERYWLRDIPPPARARDVSTLRKLFPSDVKGKVIELAPEIGELWLERAVYMQEVKSFAAERGLAVEGFKDDDRKARVFQAMGDAEYATCAGDRLILRCRAEPREGYTVPPTAPRILRKVKAVGA